MKRHASRTLLVAAALFVLVLPPSLYPQTLYYPPSGSWERRSAQEAGFDPSALVAAIDLAVAGESKAPRDQALGQAQTFGREPFGDAIGPFKTRGDMTGLIVKDGFIVAEWGEPDRVDMTHSVTKSFLTVVVGIALARGAIRDLDSPVADMMAPISVIGEYGDFGYGEKPAKGSFLELFSSEHNRKITWDDLLRQTSDWQGTLWGKPDWADRPDRDAATWLTRERNRPGTVWEYNDVRVNLLALAALNVLRQPLPEVLKEEVMDPIGASGKWRWHGYENSFVLIDGRPVQSVSGGGHWGGGMFISAFDLARFGLLVSREGVWKDKRIILREFLNRAETPTKPQPTYGYMNFYLNTDRKLYEGVPEGTVAFLGNGTNLVFIDRRNDLVIVARWIENGKINDFLAAVYRSLSAANRRSN